MLSIVSDFGCHIPIGSDFVCFHDNGGIAEKNDGKVDLNSAILAVGRKVDHPDVAICVACVCSTQSSMREVLDQYIKS